MSDKDVPEVINLIENSKPDVDQPGVQAVNPEGGIQMDNTSQVDQMQEQLYPLEISLPTSAATHAVKRYMEEQLGLAPRVEGFTIFVEATENEVEKIEGRLAWVERSMSLQKGAAKVAHVARDGAETAGRLIPVAANAIAKTTTTTASLIGRSVIQSGAYGVRAVAHDYARAKEEIVADENFQEAKSIIIGLFKNKNKSKFTGIKRG